MVIDQNNSFVNSFLKGMNTDTSLDLVSNQLYVFGQNIRITNNAILTNDIDSNNTEGIVSPVLDIYPIDLTVDKQLPSTPMVRFYSGSIDMPAVDEDNGYKILATASVDNVGAIIVKDINGLWYVIRATYNHDNKSIRTKCMFASKGTTDKNKFSVVINKETSNILKLYIADGVHGVMLINLLDDSGYYQSDKVDEEALVSSHKFPMNQVVIEEKIGGRLKTSQVQYTYRLYKKNGIVSKLAPITQRIQVIDLNRDREHGNAYDTETAVGFRLSINLDDENAFIFDHILVYRLLQTKANTNADIYLIYDAAIDNNNQNKIQLIDTGEAALQLLSIEEYTSLNSQDLVPQVIELNQNYLFASNIKDNTVIRIKDIDTDKFVAKSYKGGNPFPDDKEPKTNDWYYQDEDGYIGGGDSLSYVRYRLVTAPVSVHPSSIQGNKIIANDTPGSGIQADIKILYMKIDGANVVYENTDKYISEFFKDKGVCFDKLSYSDNFTSSMLRSLRRDEIYRYGIVLYDENGNRSDAIHVADVRVPGIIPATKVMVQNGDAGGMMPGKFTYKTYSTKISTNQNGYVSTYKKDKYSRTAVLITSGDENVIHDLADIQPTSKDVFNLKKGQLVRFNFGISDNNSVKFTTIGSLNGVPFYNFTINGLFTCKILADVVDSYGNVVESITSYGELKSIIVENDHSGCYVLIREIQLIPSVDYQDSAAINTEMYFDIEKTVEVGTYIEDVAYSVDDKDKSGLYSMPIGIEFKVDLTKLLTDKKIVGYQIVRCEKSFNYTKNLMQCVLAKPVRQYISPRDNGNGRKSPYYPTGFLTSQDVKYIDSASNLYNRDYYLEGYASGGNGVIASTDGNTLLFLMYSPDILYARDSTLSQMRLATIYMHPISFLHGTVPDKVESVSTSITEHDIIGSTSEYINIFRENMPPNISFDTGRAAYDRDKEFFSSFKENDKINSTLVGLYYLQSNIVNINNKKLLDQYDVLSVSDTKTPLWDSGFTNIDISDGCVTSGVKAYKSYETSIKNLSYTNWISSGMYDLNVGTSGRKAGFDSDIYNVYADSKHPERNKASAGWIGPAGICYLVYVKDIITDGVGTLYSIKNGSENIALGSLLCSILKPYRLYSGVSKYEKLYDVYYGFGNFLKLDNGRGTLNVFDGDVYIMPYEIITMHKTYDFNSTSDTLPSQQIVNYIPMESKYNFFFDYGLNYINTQSANILSEPSKITGVHIQDRPANLYNLVYSDNTASNDAFNARSVEDLETIYPQRTVYSQLKQNGEFIDNWTTFKAADFIDADSRYGEITNLLTVKDVLYFWQTNAFGKYSVNERSLISDQNSNTIQLGQGGVLQRSDYINTQYGMRAQDLCAIPVLSTVYWIDILRKAVVMSDGQSAVNYSEAVNVQNLVNNKISDSIPEIEYDIQNQELLCKCLNDGYQLVFSTKLNVATSVYTRQYDDTIVFNGVVVSIIADKSLQYGILNYTNEPDNDYLTPTVLSFVVNSTPSHTKVFDNQQIVTMKRGYSKNFKKEFFDNRIFQFVTDIHSRTLAGSDIESPWHVSDKEGNLLYVIPRANDSSIPEIVRSRIRGKWLKLTITDNTPEYQNSISHVITKFRQSYS